MSFRHFLFLLLLTPLVTFSPRAEAQFSGIMFGGGVDFLIDDDSSLTPLATLGAYVDVAHDVTAGPISVRPTLEYFILGSRRMQTYQINLDVVAQFASHDAYLRPFAGLGAAYGSNIDSADSGSAFGGSVIGGVALGFGQVTPLVQTRLSYVDKPHVSLMIGIVFKNSPGGVSPAPSNGRPAWY